MALLLQFSQLIKQIRGLQPASLSQFTSEFGPEVSLSLDDLIDRLHQLLTQLRSGFWVMLEPLLQGSPTLAPIGG